MVTENSGMYPILWRGRLDWKWSSWKNCHHIFFTGLFIMHVDNSGSAARPETLRWKVEQTISYDSSISYPNNCKLQLLNH